MFRFSIREMILSSALIVLAVGWIADRYRLAGQLQEGKDSQAALEKSAKNWRQASVSFARLLRSNGYDLFLTEDGESYGYVPPGAISPELAEKRNAANPLPSIEGRIILPKN